MTLAITNILTSTTAQYLTTDSYWDDWTGGYQSPITTSTSHTPITGAHPGTRSYVTPKTTSTRQTSTTTAPANAAYAATMYTTPSSRGAGAKSQVNPGSVSMVSPLYASVPDIHTINHGTTTTSLFGPRNVRTTRPASLNGSTASGDTVEGPLTNSYSAIFASQAVTDLDGHIYTIVATLTSPFPTSTILGPPGATDPDPTINPDPQRPDEVELGLALTGLQYFRAMYLPTVVAVIMKLVWSIVFASTKMMEPFYLLSRKGGASAKDSLVADYLVSTLSIAGLRNLFAGHPVVILASLAYIFISLLPALATQSTTIRAIGVCPGQVHCQPMWELNITYARVLQGVLLATVVIILVMMILSAHRQSGVFSNPSSIAAMASLLSNDKFISEIRKLQDSSFSSIRSALDPDKFMLAHYPTMSGHVRYGIVKTTEASTNPRLNHHQRQDSAASNQSAIQQALPKHRSPLSNRFLVDTVFLLAIIALLSITVAYYLTHGDNAFNNFFNSSPLRTFVLTLTASALDGRWKQLEHEVRLLTPYRRLFRGSANPEITILVPQNGTAITSFFPALWRGDSFHAFIAFVATLSDVLIIVIGGVPYSPAQIRTDFVVCSYTSWVILAVMALTVLALFRWRALNEKMMLPHDPNTLVGVWQLLCNEGNGLCEEMRGYETMQGSARDDRVKSAGVRYWAGWITEPDASRRWVVEKEKWPISKSLGGAC
ncbi:hypothetical protein H2200_013131 [Cladophialophora chaetospira]|uniref:Uncharacterized protein n=1 Tax=Cladophialophora chaetospira TaxID=386627 RepID=A0AA38WW79_9EURO|nr:hypothetical protein H2200_013131 [Cladophialophora chaetospira]